MVTELPPIPISIEDEMKSSFMDYAMSVIVARALPNARDGLKPVHRRILFAQHQANNVYNRPYVKCARVVGDVLGKFHPHGDTATYDALVRMAQDFSMRYTLIDGQGNFGSIDGDPPAAYRYTECRMTRLASEMMQDIAKETVDWVPNYDEKEVEPVVLPAKVPNLLLNGASGIAVGMATNIPPHNLGEIVDATIAYMRKPDISVEELIKMVPGPDFPTGAVIHGRSGIEKAYRTGRGRIVIRGTSEIEELKKDRYAIVVSAIPFQVNKVHWIEQIAALVRDKRLDGISDIRDQSARNVIRVVIELKKDAVAQVVLNNLYKMTALQTTFGINMLAIVDGRPRLLTLKDALARFVEHRREVVTRRTIFELKNARSRRELVEGLGVAVTQIDRVIEIIRASKDPDEAKTRLTAEPLAGLVGFLERAGRPAAEVEAARAQGAYTLNDRQAQAILEMRLQRLTGLERDKLEAEYRELCETIARLEIILADDKRLVAVIIEELEEIRAQYQDERRTKIIAKEAEIATEELIAEEDMVVTVTHHGYVKRTPVSEYRAQKRGGRGIQGAASAADDFVADMFVASTHDQIMMFTDMGRVYKMKVYDLPKGRRASKGKAIVNVIALKPDEKVVTMLPVKEFAAGFFVFMATQKGTIKKTELSLFANIRTTGIRAISMDEGDALVAVRLTDGNVDVFLGTRNGYATRFHEGKVRQMGRDARGVRGISLRGGDEVIGLATIPPELKDAWMLTVCERGYGKRTVLTEYPTKNRGGKGVITVRTTVRNGKAVAIRVVSEEDHLILITDRGKLIRIRADGIPTVGRATQGVVVMRVEGDEVISSVARLADTEDDSIKESAVVESTLDDDDEAVADDEEDGDHQEDDDEGDDAAADEGESDDEEQE